MSRIFRVPGVTIVVGLIVAALFLDQGREPVVVAVDELVSPVPVVAPANARSATWFCAAGTTEPASAADALVVLANTTTEQAEAIVSVFTGSSAPSVGAAVEELVVEIPQQDSVDLRLADLTDSGPIVSIAVEVDQGGVIADKIVSGPTGVARSACSTDGSEAWVVPSGSTAPGARHQLVLFNPFPDDAIVDVDFVADSGTREPEDLTAMHVPARSSRLVEIGEFVAAAETVSTFVEARSGRVVVEAIQIFDGSADPLGLGLVAGVPAPAESWTFAGVAPRTGPARLVVVNPSETIVRADVEVYPSGAERFIEPLQLTLRAGQHAVVDLLADGRLEGIPSFSVIVRSFDGPRLVAGLEQRPPEPETGALAELLETDAPTTGFAGSAGQALESSLLLTAVEVTEGDETSALHLFNPSDDTFVTVEAAVLGEGASRPVSLEVGPGRTLRVPLAELAIGRSAVVIRASAPLIGARAVTGLSSRSWAPLLVSD